MGKYDPQNGLAQLIEGKSPDVAKIFEDEHVLVFMPLPEEEVVAPGHVLVVPKRMGARNLLDLKPDEMGDLLLAVQKAAIAQKNGLGATGFRVQQNNGLSLATLGKLASVPYRSDFRLSYSRNRAQRGGYTSGVWRMGSDRL